MFIQSLGTARLEDRLSNVWVSKQPTRVEAEEEEEKEEEEEYYACNRQLIGAHASTY